MGGSRHIHLSSLHSNLVIFKFNLLDRFIKKIIFTFQSGYIQILSQDLLLRILFSLHSNLVIFKLYANCVRNSSIQSLHSNLVIFKSLPHLYPISQFRTLHSNLVIFKSICSSSTIISKSDFTFQSGYIQIYELARAFLLKVSLHSNLVIFKSIIVIAF